MVATRLDLLRQARVHPLAVVTNDARLAVQQRLCASDPAAERFDDRLVAEADAERGGVRAERSDELDGHTRVLGASRPRRDHEPVGRERLCLLDRDRVVAKDVDLGAEFLEQVHEVPGEGVVVVDHQELHAYSSSARAIAASRAASFARHSRCSASGSESATTPAPAWRCTTPSATTIVRSAMHVSIVPPGRT